MKKSNITFVIFTYNEERRIEKVIKNFKDYGRILISDNNSTDSTREIAKKYNCDILLRTNDYVYVENQELVNQIYESVETDWIYWGFADEMLEKRTLDKIIDIVKSDKFDIIDIDRKNYNDGKFAHEFFHSYVFKAFKRHAIDFSNNKIHGMGKPMISEDRIYKMESCFYIHHFSNYTAASYLNTINRYTEEEALGYEKTNFSLSKVLFLFIKRIIKNYFFDKGYKLGQTGLNAILMTICYEWVKQVKIYENSNNLTRRTIEDKNDRIRDFILQDFIEKKSFEK